MDLVDNSTYLIEKVVQEVKSQGLFDQFRKECISDVDTSNLTFFFHYFSQLFTIIFINSRTSLSKLEKTS